MKKSEKPIYPTPKTRVVEMKLEGVIAASGDPKYNSWENQDWS